MMFYKVDMLDIEAGQGFYEHKAKKVYVFFLGDDFRVFSQIHKDDFVGIINGTTVKPIRYYELCGEGKISVNRISLDIMRRCNQYFPIYTIKKKKGYRDEWDCEIMNEDMFGTTKDRIASIVVPRSERYINFCGDGFMEARRVFGQAFAGDMKNVFNVSDVDVKDGETVDKADKDLVGDTVVDFIEQLLADRSMVKREKNGIIRLSAKEEQRLRIEYGMEEEVKPISHSARSRPLF